MTLKQRPVDFQLRACPKIQQPGAPGGGFLLATQTSADFFLGLFQGQVLGGTYFLDAENMITVFAADQWAQFAR